MELLFADQVFPFAVSLCLMLLIALIQVLGMVTGAGISEAIESLLPETDMGLEAEPGALEGGAVASMLGWLHVGRVPVLVLLVVFLTGFGLAGYAVQLVLQNSIGMMLPASLAVIPSFLAAVPVLRVSGTVLARIMPKDETTVLRTSSFIGHVATIVVGHARQDLPAEAKLQDRFGTDHFLRVIPEEGADQINQGAEVLLVRKQGDLFVVIENTDPALQHS